jgi:hypothetical protein
VLILFVWKEKKKKIFFFFFPLRAFNLSEIQKDWIK